MILKRIERGARRTTLIARTKFEAYKNNNLNTRRIVGVIRHLTTTTLALSIASTPVLSLVGTAHAMSAEDGGPVPNLSRVDEGVLNSLHFAPESPQPISITDSALANLNIGKSVADTIQEEKERKQAEAVAEAARLAEEAKKARLKVAKPNVVMNLGDVQNTAKQLTVDAFGEAEWPYMNTLILRESNYNPNAVNGASGACGIPQALPCSKLKDRSVTGQISWMIGYVRSRYGTPSRAVSFHNNHNWY